MDDIRAFRQTEFALHRNLQASSAKAPGFAIRCGSADAYAHKCGANLPSIERRHGHRLPITVRATSHAVFDLRQIHVPSGHFVGGRLLPDAGPMAVRRPSDGQPHAELPLPMP